jgi:CYTH domain-containing protein
MTQNIEIERKFLVHCDLLPKLSNGKKIIQAYIFVEKDKELRIRLQEDKCKMTLKIAIQGNIREEYDYNLEVFEGIKLIEKVCDKTPIKKIRYNLKIDGFDWDIDFFEDLNQGLILAEIELKEVDQVFSKPKWLGKEVTHDRRYYNSNLYLNPYFHDGFAIKK